MKTINLELPVEEALALIKTARAESRCLIENGDVLPDIDVLKTAQLYLSARERIVTALEEFAGLEEAPAELPQGALDLTMPNRPNSPAIDSALTAATTRLEDEPDRGSLAMKHGVPTVVLGEGEVDYDYLKHEDVLGRNHRPTLTERDW